MGQKCQRIRMRHPSSASHRTRARNTASLGTEVWTTSTGPLKPSIEKGARGEATEDFREKGATKRSKPSAPRCPVDQVQARIVGCKENPLPHNFAQCDRPRILSVVTQGKQGTIIYGRTPAKARQAGDSNAKRQHEKHVKRRKQRRMANMAPRHCARRHCAARTMCARRVLNRGGALQPGNLPCHVHGAPTLHTLYDSCIRLMLGAIMQ